MDHTIRPRCHLLLYKEDIMAEGNCVHCVSVTEYHPINYTDNFFEVSCEVSINTSCRYVCQDVTDHRVKRAQRDVLRILGVNWPFFQPYKKRKRKNNFGPGTRDWFRVKESEVQMLLIWIHFIHCRYSQHISRILSIVSSYQRKSSWKENININGRNSLYSHSYSYAVLLVMGLFPPNNKSLHIYSLFRDFRLLLVQYNPFSSHSLYRVIPIVLTPTYHSRFFITVQVFHVSCTQLYWIQ
jgi:hypothetical protein